MVEKIAYMLENYDEDKDNDRKGFIQVRLVGPRAKHRAPKVQRKKELNFLEIIP